MTDIEKLLRDRVELFVAELSDIIRQAALERVSDALAAPGGSGRGKRSAAALEKRVGKRPKGQKRAPAEMERLLKAIVAAVQNEPGIRADQIANSLSLATRDTSLPIKKLLADKVLTKKGQKRATQYFPGRRG
jgi:hypothetical protein